MDKQHSFLFEHGPTKERLVNTALIITSVIFSLLALEVGLRAYKGEWTYINFRRGSDSSAAFDAELGWVP